MKNLKVSVFYIRKRIFYQKGMNVCMCVNMCMCVIVCACVRIIYVCLYDIVYMCDCVCVNVCVICEYVCLNKY